MFPRRRKHAKNKQTTTIRIDREVLNNIFLFDARFNLSAFVDDKIKEFVDEKNGESPTKEGLLENIKKLQEVLKDGTFVEDIEKKQATNQ